MSKQVVSGKLHELEPRLSNKKNYEQYRYMMSYGKNPDEIYIANYEEGNNAKYIYSYDRLEKVEEEKETFNGILAEYSICKEMGGIKIYTTETYRDVINHFIINSKDLSKVDNQDIMNSIVKIESDIEELKEKKYKLLGMEYENIMKKK